MDLEEFKSYQNKYIFNIEVYETLNDLLKTISKLTELTNKIKCNEIHYDITLQLEYCLKKIEQCKINLDQRLID